MNFYKHHLGDYAAATAHLTWDEDCAYRRLIDQYYKREAPIPADLKEACRLVRASTPSQRKAVAAVLQEFFTLADDGWHQKRCDEEIAAATAQAATNRRIAEEREAKKRARMAHESSQRSIDDPNTNRANPETTNRAESVNLARLQTPDSRLQTPLPPSAPAAAVAPAVAARVDLVARFKAAEILPSNTGLLDQLVAAGVTWDEIEPLLPTARGGRNALAYIAAAIAAQRERAASTVILPRTAVTTAPPQAESFRERDERLAREKADGFMGRTPAHQPARQGEIIDVEATDVAPRQLG